LVVLRATAARDAEFADSMCAPPVVYHHVPFFDGERPAGAQVALELFHIYAFMLEGARPAIARAVELIAASRLPTVFHCAAGKDRTGVLSAVLLGALGVPDDAIIDDYVATKHGLARIVDRLRASESYQYVFDELPADTLHAEPATMQKLLAHARRRFGSWRDYLRTAGIDDETLEALEATLLER
jgi:protein-tyrosine phosphatase